ncbi:MAG: hypothetical protein H5U40_10715, partial [Polyangiaceae bacterium]|nr:hypothetical protein [Polyangiaceae bacterium]
APEPDWVGPPDRFYPNARHFWPSGAPIVQDTSAYIVNDTIVMTVPSSQDFELILDNRSVPIRMSEGYIVAHMDRTGEDGMPANIDRGLLAGRFPLMYLSNIGSYVGICTGLGDLYGSFADLRAVPLGAGEVADLEEPCGAVSMGVGFQATRAIWAATGPSQPAPIWCNISPTPTPPAHCL